MPSKIMISDMVEGQVIESWFLIANSILKSSQNGRDYLELRLTDKSGEITMRIWNSNEDLAEKLQQGKVMIISGLKVDSYKGKNQFALDAPTVSRYIKTAQCKDYDMTLLLPSTSRDINELTKSLKDIVDSVRDLNIRYFLLSLVTDKQFMEAFTVWPAAVRHHHAYMGGLLEHTVGVLNLCTSAFEFYDTVNPDLLVAGALLHDIGKLAAYDYDMATGVVKISKAGVLYDHIPLGIEMFRNRLDKLIQSDRKFKSTWLEEYGLNIEHMILSHHGKKEWGSPVEPVTIEAVVLHHADYTDSHVNKMERYIKTGAVAPGEFAYAEDVRTNIYIAAPDDSKSKAEVAAGQQRLF